MDLLYDFGEYGPIILIIFSWYFLWNNKKLFFYYTIGIFLNAILNIILKGIIQEPRPIFDKKKINLLTIHSKNYFYQNGIPFNIFGMPSGHIQSAAFSSFFIYKALKKINILWIFLFFTLLISYQRVKYNYHTISQVIVGFIVGSMFAILIYWFSQEIITGKIREKPDDFGPK